METEMPASVEIINTGNELLDGRVSNTNGQRMARICSARGLTVRRITVVGDALEDISAALKEALARGPDLVLLTGGLGPTPDDMTAEAIALALGRKFVLNEEALGMVKRAYERKGLELTTAVVKMAKLPEGAVPLENPIGTAPGILVEEGRTKIVALPGVPEEMEAMFERHVEPILAELARGLARYEARFLAFGVREADLAGALKELRRAYPDVYVKTHPKADEGRRYLEIYVATVSPSASEARKRMEKVIMELSEHISALGGSMTPLKPEEGA